METTMDTAVNTLPALLPAHVVSLLLSYLSSLDEPLPPHLVSAPLLQRHHFLGLGRVLESAQDAAGYLSWPSASGSEEDMLRVVELLNSLPSPENFDPLNEYSTKYSYDGDAFYAHAHVPVDTFYSGDSAGLRLIFRWEAKDNEGAVEADSWKYHDAKPMPFPPNAYDAPGLALQPPANPLAAENATRTEVMRSPSVPRLSSEPTSHPGTNLIADDDAYWDAYGRSSSDDENGFYNYSQTVANNEADDEKAEDAYWAQYASVHGTADSTRHSPHPQKRKLHEPSQPVSVQSSDHYSSHCDRYGSQEFLTSDAPRSSAYDPYDTEHINYLHRFSAHNGGETSPGGSPHPEALSRRLHNLSPRISATPSPAPPETDVETVNLEHLELENVNSPDTGSSYTSDGRTLTPPGDIETAAIPEMVLSGSPPHAHKSRERGDDSSLREAIKGVYTLWATGRDGYGTIDARNQKDEFFDIVRDALKSI